MQERGDLRVMFGIVINHQTSRACLNVDCIDAVDFADGRLELIEQSRIALRPRKPKSDPAMHGVGDFREVPLYRRR